MKKNMPDEPIIDIEENSSDNSSAGVTGSDDLLSKIESLKDDLNLCKKERSEYLDGWQRTLADYANQKKDYEEKLIRARTGGQEALIEDLISVIDTFDHAFANKAAWESVQPEWRMGVEYIYQQFSGVLEKYGLQSYGKEGEIFDPILHESIELENKDDAPPDTIARVINRGFKLNDKIIRPARVAVYK